MGTNRFARRSRSYIKGTMAADRVDEENLKATSFERGEWGDVPIALDMDYDMVAEIFGSAAAPLATMTPLALVALVFVTGELDPCSSPSFSCFPFLFVA